MQPQQNTLATEIILGAVSSLAIIGAVVLLALGKIDYAECAGLFGGVFALWGANALYKASSPAQQNQLNTLQSQQIAQNANLQQLIQYVLSVLPGLVQQPQAPVASPQSQQTAQPVQAQSPVAASVVAPGAHPVPGPPPAQTQFKSITIPDVSMPTIPVVGQGIPLGQ